MSKQVAKKEQAGLPSYMKQYEGAGKENIERDDIIIPRLKLGQGQSPEVQAKKAEVGDIIHNITSEVICKAGETLAFVPVCVFKEYIIWFDRNGPKEGGGANRAYREVQTDGSVHL